MGPRGCGYENISIQINEKVRQGDHAQLGEREVYWQDQIRCFVQNGAGGDTPFFSGLLFRDKH